MSAITTRRPRWGIMLGAAAMAVAGLSVATPASAYGWHGGWHGGWGWGPGISLGFGYPYGYPYGYGYAYAPPVVYAPPAYYPPRTYYSQSSVTIAPPVAHHTVRHHVVHHAAQAPSCPIPQSNSSPQTDAAPSGSISPQANAY